VRSGRGCVVVVVVAGWLTAVVGFGGGAVAVVAVFDPDPEHAARQAAEATMVTTNLARRDLRDLIGVVEVGCGRSRPRWFTSVIRTAVQGGHRRATAVRTEEQSSR
jgi:hypothetical protein